eukprot:58714-Hanusia_phi.AAC.1
MHPCCQVDSELQYPYGLTKDSTEEEEAAFIGYPVGNTTPTGCADGFTANVRPDSTLRIYSISCSHL